MASFCHRQAAKKQQLLILQESASEVFNIFEILVSQSKAAPMSASATKVHKNAHGS